MSPQLLLELEPAQNVSTTSQVSDAKISAAISSKQTLRGFSVEHTKTLERSLNSFFQGKQEETRLMQARRILGTSVANISDEDLEVKISGFQYLLECWMDSFERSIFDNQTLTQVLKGE